MVSLLFCRLGLASQNNSPKNQSCTSFWVLTQSIPSMYPDIVSDSIWYIYIYDPGSRFDSPPPMVWVPRTKPLDPDYPAICRAPASNLHAFRTTSEHQLLYIQSIWIIYITRDNTCVYIYIYMYIYIYILIYIYIYDQKNTHIHRGEGGWRWAPRTMAMGGGGRGA